MLGRILLVTPALAETDVDSTTGYFPQVTSGTRQGRRARFAVTRPAFAHRLWGLPPFLPPLPAC